MLLWRTVITLFLVQKTFVKLNGGKFFSKIDVTNAYLQILVEEESLKLLCINMHCGSYKFECLQFGVNVAPAIFQQVMDTMLSGLDFSVTYLDDILMNSKSVVKHKDHVHKVFAKIQDYDFKIKETKWDFFIEKVKYLEHIIDKDGRRPDSEWAAAIKNMLVLHCRAWTSKLLPGIHTKHAWFACTLNEQLKKDKPWDWTAECLEAFEKIKKTLILELFLTHYDLEIIVNSDICLYGVGACILHKMTNETLKRIERTFLPVEKNYSQIVKEALGIIFTVSKFHQYIYGRHFALQTPLDGKNYHSNMH